MTSKISTLLVAAVTAPAIAAVAAMVSAQESPPTDVTGAVLTCANGAQVQERFRMDGDNWEITGVMTSGPDVSITVAGPTGDVTVVPTVNLEVGAGVEAGGVVMMTGTTVAATGEMVATTLVDACGAAGLQPSPEATDEPTAPEDGAVADVDDDDEAKDGAECNGGPVNSGELRAKIKNGKAHIQRGTVTSADGGTITVETPEGPVTVIIDGETKVRGDTESAAEVRVRGDIDDGVVQAEDVRVLCADAGDQQAGDDVDDGADEGDEGDEDEDEAGDDDGDEGGKEDDEGEDGEDD
jgi:hypothetical protein